MRPSQPYIPRPAVLWKPLSFWVWAFFIVVALNAVPHVLVQYWFNQSLGFQTIFWTDLRMQAALFLLSWIEDIVTIGLPAYAFAVSPTLRRVLLHMGTWVGLVSGWLLAQHHGQFLLAFNGAPFGVVDPVFQRDIGFYVYVLPAVRTLLAAMQAGLALGLASALVARYGELTLHGDVPWRQLGVRRAVALFAVPYMRWMVGIIGTLATVQIVLSRYDLVFKDNAATGVRTGAGYVDVVGIVSSLNRIHVLAAAVLGLTVVAVLAMRRSGDGGRRAAVAERLEDVPRPTSDVRWMLHAAIALVVLPLAFSVAVIVRTWVFVTPNEPHVQRQFIERHIDATRRGFRLDRVEIHEWTPPKDPLKPETLLASRTVQNAPVLPSWVTSLEEPPDIQHYQRVKASKSTMVFGPLLQIYQQQQQLRPYYDFLSVDGVRYTVNGEKRMFVSAVRELPSLALVGEKEWLKYWGSAALQFTHGMGLVMSPVNRVTDSGEPLFASKNVPPQVDDDALAHEPRIYFGEGMKDDYALTGANGLKEFDYATEQSRREFTFSTDGGSGVLLDSWLKRVAFAVYTRDFTAFLFSDFIDPTRTRVHIHRTPMSRARTVAPFLFLDSNAYAFIADNRVLWMINGLTTSDQYPYSYREVLGDKADERAVEEFPERVINYAEDSVKITMDAYTGRLHLYRMTDDPIVRSWERIYPDLFDTRDEMPPAVAAQLTYPLQWFHVQFDDIYKRYHQVDPVQFYNVEDLWDDADETIGSMGRGLVGFGTGDQMTFSYEGYNALLDPADMPAGVDIGAPGELQYAMLMPFTPEAARNLRSLVIALQDPGSYGRLISLQVPQGIFVPGPEQIDAYIDNDRPVHQQVTMWIRHASEVLRGSTVLLPVGGDLMYVETVWVNSLQNDLPQLKLFAVRYHDRITSGTTLADAILKRNLFSETPPDLWAVDSPGRDEREGDQQRRNGDRRANAHELAQRDMDTQPPARLDPDQPGKRADRQQARAEIAAD